MKLKPVKLQTALAVWKQNKIAIVLLALSVLATLLSWQLAKLTMRKSEQLRFNDRVAIIQSQLVSHYASYIDPLYADQGLFAASDSVTRKEWDYFFNQLQASGTHPAIVSSSYAEVVPIDQRSSFINEVKDDVTVSENGFPEFTIFPPDTGKTAMVNKYITPLQDNQKLLGKDLQADPTTSEAIDRARDSGNPSIAVMDNPSRHDRSFMIFLPIYRHGAKLESVNDHRENLIGVVSSTIDSNRFFSDLTKATSKDSGINIDVYDGNEVTASNLIYESAKSNSSDSKKDSEPPLEKTINFIQGGQSWKVVIHGDGRLLLNSVENGLPAYILTIGVIFSLLLFGITYTNSHSRQQAMIIADSMTRKLADSEQRIHNIIASSPIVLIVFDKSGKITLTDGSGLSDMKMKPGDMVGTNIFDTYKGNADVLKAINQALTGETSTVEIKEEEKYYEVRYSPIKDLGGVITGAIGVSFDITERRKSEQSLETRTEELERLNNTMVGRELKMIELKKRINSLESKKRK